MSWKCDYTFRFQEEFPPIDKSLKPKIKFELNGILFSFLPSFLNSLKTFDRESSRQGKWGKKKNKRVGYINPKFTDQRQLPTNKNYNQQTNLLSHKLQVVRLINFISNACYINILSWRLRIAMQPSSYFVHPLRNEMSIWVVLSELWSVFFFLITYWTPWVI